MKDYKLYEHKSNPKKNEMTLQPEKVPILLQTNKDQGEVNGLSHSKNKKLKH